MWEWKVSVWLKHLQEFTYTYIIMYTMVPTTYFVTSQNHLYLKFGLVYKYVVVILSKFLFQLSTHCALPAPRWRPSIYVLS